MTAKDWKQLNVVTMACVSYGLRKEEFLLFKLIYFERQSRRGTEEREGERESQAGSVLSVHSPMRGLNPRTVRSRPELKPRVGCLTN